MGVALAACPPVPSVLIGAEIASSGTGARRAPVHTRLLDGACPMLTQKHGGGIKPRVTPPQAVNPETVKPSK